MHLAAACLCFKLNSWRWMHTSASQCSALLLEVLPGLSCPVALLDPAAAVASAQRAAASPRLVPALRLARPANTISYAKKNVLMCWGRPLMKCQEQWWCSRLSSSRGVKSRGGEHILCLKTKIHSYSKREGISATSGKENEPKFQKCHPHHS